MRTKKLKAGRVGVIGKVLRLLELLDRSRSGLSLKDVAAQASLNKSTAHRFLTHLEVEGYLFRDGAGKYMLGPKMQRLGSGINFQTTLCKMCRPILEDLWTLTGETVNLAVLDGTDVLYLDVIESLHTFRLATEVGMRRPVHCTSLGKAMLANLNSKELQQDILNVIQFQPAKTKAITDAASLQKEIARIRARGFALDDEEAVEGARCIGAAIFDADGKVIGGISVSGPVVRLTRAHVPRFSAAICAAAAQISKKLGFTQPMDPQNRPAIALASEKARAVKRTLSIDSHPNLAGRVPKH